MPPGSISACQIAGSGSSSCWTDLSRKRTLQLRLHLASGPCLAFGSVRSHAHVQFLRSLQWYLPLGNLHTKTNKR